ncbi:calcium-translocating P-type ATPase, PMCA-type [Deltaproteobacteria bacterium OttesenSCG-928-M10]|nr:calcium-translocating P-type ATPase, PMCA-type [Deltaproteobacteria bacterium OttesenSCG-928-M10]
MSNQTGKPEADNHDALEFPGLTPAEVEENRRQHGANVLTPPPRDPWWKLYLEKFEDPIIRVLLVAAVIAILAGLVEGHYTEGIGIIIAVLLATTLGFINEYRAGQEFDVLNQVSDDEPIKVIRDHRYTSVPKRDLVVGDILVLEQGEEIPADAEVLSSVSFQVNEASLTGESVPVAKRPRAAAEGEAGLAYPRHQVLRGTFVSDGHALARVTTVGDSSEIGQTARAASEETEIETPLNRQLARLGQVIGVCGFGVAFLIFSALTVKAVWQGDLGESVTVARAAVSADIGAPDDQAVRAARDTLRVKYGDIVNELPVLSKTVDEEKTYYLHMPLTNGQIYFLALTALSLMVALTRIWLPVVCDAVELTGRERPAGGWIAKEGFTPWLQSAAAGLVLFAAAVGLGLSAGWLSGSPSSWLPVSAALALLRFFMVAVTIIVVAVPEGLPMSVTLSLAYSMRKMTAANNLVRRMHACETIGAATVICSDKTGTLTMNEMRVSSSDFANQPEAANHDGLEWRLTAEAIAANSTANLGADETGRLTKPLGNPTESALLIWLEENGDSYQARRAAFPVAGQLTFSTERKYMATIGSGALAGGLTLHAKGAPEIVLSRCQARRLADGQTAALSEEERERLLAELRAEQNRGMRTLGFAYRQVEGGASEYGPDHIQKLVEDGSLIWLGFFSIADPVRPEVPDAVRDCTRAGVRVKMVTGDNQATAREIAAEIGMISPGEDSPGLAVTGDEFMAMDDETAEKSAGELKIMSRAKPLAKQRLVTLLQKRGEVVAVTGDGSNDAPALNHADVGLAMGITGTSVAKEAADIILLDDSFASIVKAVMWGRSLYANIQKFILFQLTINVTALGVALLGPFLGIQLPLTVTQMLWVNLIMDTFAALALASEPPDWSVMEKPPRPPEAFIVTPDMGRFIFTVGGIFLAMFLVLVLGLKHIFPMDPETSLGRHNLSIFFSVFVFLQFWNLFNARVLGRNRSAFSRLGESRPFLAIMLVIGIGQIILTQVGGEVFRTVPLSFQEWVLIIVCTSPVLWVGEIIRVVKRSAGRPKPESATADKAAGKNP